MLTASYEARPFGVRSAMPLYKARAACPQLVVVPPEMMKYRDVSRQIFEIFRRGGRAVEGLSLDEAFIALGTVTLDAARESAAQVRREVFEATALTVSAGVATGKMIAKIASDFCKPDGLLTIAPGEEAAFLAPLPVGRLSGIGPKMQARLNVFGIATIGDVRAARRREPARALRFVVARASRFGARNRPAPRRDRARNEIHFDRGHLRVRRARRRPSRRVIARTGRGSLRTAR